MNQKQSLIEIEELFFLDEWFLSQDQHCYSEARVFSFTIDEEPILKFNPIVKGTLFEYIVINFHLPSQKDCVSSQSNIFSLKLNSQILNEIYGNNPKELEGLNKHINKRLLNGSIHGLIVHYFAGIRELLNDIKILDNSILHLKTKEILYLLSYAKNFNVLNGFLMNLLINESNDFQFIIENNLYSINTISELAEKTNMSLSKFKKRFREVYHTTPNRYLISKRIEKVAYLLKHSNDTISAIGYECGFVAPAHLTRVFKAKYNKTPSEYRLQNIN